MEGAWVAESGGRALRWAGPCRARKVATDILLNIHGTSSVPAQHHQQHSISQAHNQAQQSMQPQQQRQQQHVCQMSSRQEQEHQRMVADAGWPGKETVKGHELKCSWRVKLKECVDAAPVVLISHCEGLQQQEPLSQQPSQPDPLDGRSGQQPPPQQQQQQTEHQQAGQHALQQHQDRQAPQQARQQQHWVFACSHGGDVVCVEGRSGGVVWEGQVEGRAEAGLTVSPDCRVSLHLPALPCQRHSASHYQD